MAYRPPEGTEWITGKRTVRGKPITAPGFKVPTSTGGGGGGGTISTKAPTTKKEYYYRKGDKFIKASRPHPELASQGYQTLTKEEYEISKAEVKEKIQEEKIRTAIRKLGEARTEKERHKWAKEIYALGGQLVPGEILAKAGIPGVKKGEVYVAPREWRLPGEIKPKPTVSKILTKEVPPSQTLKQIKQEKLYVYIDIPSEIKRKFNPIDWVKEARKRGKEVRFTERVGDIPSSAIVFRSDQFSIKKGKLYLHDLPIWLEAKIKEKQLLEWQKRRGVREQYRELPTWKKGIVAVRRGLIDIPGTVELAYLKATGQTEKYEKKLTDILVEEYGLEKQKAKGIVKAEISAFTKGAGLIAISRPIGFGITTGLNTVSNFSKFVSSVISAGLSGYGLGSAISYIGEPVLRKEYGEALGRGVLVGGALLGTISGSYHAKKLGVGLKPKTVKLKPKEVLLSGIKKTKGKVTYRAGKIYVKTKEGIIKGVYAGRTVKDGRVYYRYDFPQQKVGKVVIKKQVIDIAEKDLITWSNKITKHLTYKKSLRAGVKLTKISPEQTLELSLQNVRELTLLKTKRGVTAFKRAGSVKDVRGFVEKGLASPKGVAGKGLMAKPDYTYRYYYVEKTIPKTKGFDYTPVIKSTKGAEKSVVTALKQMEALRRLQDAKLTASINKGNVGRILPALLKPTEIKTKDKGKAISPGERMTRIITHAVQEQQKILKPRKKEEYIAPRIISATALVYRPVLRQAQLLDTLVVEDIEGALRQAQYVEPLVTQTQTQAVRQVITPLLRPRINIPELSKIPEPYPIEIGRPGRIVPPFWSHYFYARLGKVANINTILRQIRHQLMPAEQLLGVPTKKKKRR